MKMYGLRSARVRSCSLEIFFITHSYIHKIWFGLDLRWVPAKAGMYRGALWHSMPSEEKQNVMYVTFGPYRRPSGKTENVT
jgi:hypothetical protein